MHSDGAEIVALAKVHRAKVGFADAGSILQHRLNTDSSSPVDELMTRSTSAVAVCCSAIGEISYAQFVEQPRILDGDDRLGGKVLDQFDLLVAERANLLPVD